jgi:hypothetical protein
LHSKTTGWFTKRTEIDPTCPTLTKSVTKVAHAFLYIDGLSVAPNCAFQVILPSSISERSIALKRLAGSPKGAVDPNLPHAK